MLRSPWRDGGQPRRAQALLALPDVTDDIARRSVRGAHPQGEKLMRAGGVCFRARRRPRRKRLRPWLASSAPQPDGGRHVHEADDGGRGRFPVLEEHPLAAAAQPVPTRPPRWSTSRAGTASRPTPTSSTRSISSLVFIRVHQGQQLLFPQQDHRRAHHDPGGQSRPAAPHRRRLQLQSCATRSTSCTPSVTARLPGSRSTTGVLQDDNNTDADTPDPAAPDRSVPSSRTSTPWLTPTRRQHPRSVTPAWSARWAHRHTTSRTIVVTAAPGSVLHYLCTSTLDAGHRRR